MLLALFSCGSAGGVSAEPSPDPNVHPVPGLLDAPQSSRYHVNAGGHVIEVKDEPYDFDVAMFTMGTTPVRVDVVVASDFDSFTLKPDRHGIEVERIERTLRFTIDQPHKLVLQIPGQKPLAIIATPNETNVPSPEDSDVIYFKPGVTEAGVIRPKSGQTVYLAPGAVVQGRIEASGVQDVRVMGRGILATEGYALRYQKKHGILFDDCENVLVEGISMRSFDTWWQSLFLNTINAEVAHVNFFGVGMNTDGVDIDAVKNFLVRDSFLRVEDDGLGWHALDAEANGEMITENAVADNLVIWNTKWGNGIRIGSSMEAQLWRDITIRNVDILKHAGCGIISDFSDWAWLDNLRFEGIVIEGTYNPIHLVLKKTRYSNNTGYLDQRGHMRGILFEDVKMKGGGVKLEGFDESHRIRSVYFNNCSVKGKPLDPKKGVKANAFVDELHFNEPFQPVSREPKPGMIELEDCESRVMGGAQYLADVPDASLGRLRVFEARKVEAYIEHDLSVATAGSYRMSLLVRSSPDSGTATLSFNGREVGPFDLSSSESEYREIDLGAFVVDEAGIFKMRLTSTSEGSALFELDALRLSLK